MRNLMILALALLAAGPALAPCAYSEIGMNQYERDHARGTETPRQFRRWADGRVDKLQKAFKTTGKDIDGYDEDTRRSAEGKLDGLKERLSKVEGRLDEVGDRDTKDAWSDRKDIRSELRDIDKDYSGLRRDLKSR